MKKVYCVGMIKNEADIIESYIRYHLQIFDGIVLLDNGSTDRTLEIINQLKAEGLPIYLKQDNSLEYIQGEKTTELINETFDQFDADYIFPLDVDEFLIAPGFHENPRKLVEQLSTNKVYYLERAYTYFPINLNENEVFIPKRITYASPIKDYWPKVTVSKEIWKTYSPDISGGNHDLLFDKTGVEVEVSDKLKLMHFPYRSSEHLKSKILVGWINTLACYNYHEGFNYHWHDIYEELKKNNLHFNMDTILEHNEIYVPMDLSFCQSIELKYTTANEVSAINNLLSYCEALARSYGKEQLEKRQREWFG